ncbi:MAG: TlpA family protein disulfide reductase [Polyangiaceae bacterium]|nr:TlpA family protein disulfide reductase [Polyangiaceae bacterium]
MSLRRARAAVALAALLSLAAGCGAGAPPPPPVEAAPGPALPPRGPRRAFSFETLDGKELSAASLAGRISVIGFVTTYDVASQVEARHLAGLYRAHRPRLNVALLVLEAPETRPLFEAFAASLTLPYPVAIADAATIAGQGPFAGLHHVPSVVILDRQGREAVRQIGLASQDALEQLVRAVEASEKAPAARPDR